MPNLLFMGLVYNFFAFSLCLCLIFVDFCLCMEWFRRKNCTSSDRFYGYWGSGFYAWIRDII